MTIDQQRLLDELDEISDLAGAVVARDLDAADAIHTEQLAQALADVLTGLEAIAFADDLLDTSAFLRHRARTVLDVDEADVEAMWSRSTAPLLLDAVAEIETAARRVLRSCRRSFGPVPAHTAASWRCSSA